MSDAADAADAGETSPTSEESQPDFFHQIFHPSLPRLGPGDDASTLRALRRLYPANSPAADPEEARSLRILDVGCGTGPQTLVLARETGGRILAIDNHRPFLDELERRAGAAGLTERIETRVLDMAQLDSLAPEGPFDVVWAEGSLFVIGVEEGLRLAHSVLRPRGHLAFTELTWLRPDPPDEIVNYFTDICPMIDTAGQIGVIRRSGYRLVDAFPLPESSWWYTYYQPLQARLNTLRRAEGLDEASLGLLDMIQREIDMYSRLSDYYGYVFYLLQRSK